VLEEIHQIVGCREVVRVAEHDERAHRRPLDEAHGRLEDDRAGALAAHERPPDVKAVLGEELVEVVSGDAPRDVGVACANQVAVAVAEALELAVDLALPAALANDSVELLVARRADAHAMAVVGEDLELLDVVRGPRPLAVELRQH
jgi:hypothetical protein